MTDIRIEQLVRGFRAAIEVAHNRGFFSNDICFKVFPKGCCGDTSYLLAEFLLRKGVETIWFSAQRGGWGHAWLVIKDTRVTKPTPQMFSWPENIREVVAKYGVEHPEQVIDVTRYGFDNLRNGLIVDITGDQFEDYNSSVYVGYLDLFHQSFDFIQAHDYNGLNDRRLCFLYQVIMKNMDEEIKGDN